jgi:hypothetical protein
VAEGRRYPLVQGKTSLVESHCALAIYILKSILRAKEELWKFKYFTMQKYNLPKKILSKKPKSFKIL